MGISTKEKNNKTIDIIKLLWYNCISLTKGGSQNVRLNPNIKINKIKGGDITVVKQKLCPKCKGDMYYMVNNSYEMCDCDDGYITITYREERESEDTYLRQNSKRENN